VSERTLIRGGCVLTLGDRTTNFNKADVLIEDELVTEVGPGLRSRGAEVIDGADTIVMPGFVDTHRHVWKSLFRNLGDGTSVSAEVFGPHYQADDLYAATLIGLLGALEAGITTIVDWSDLQISPEHTAAALQAHADARIRSVFVPVPPVWDVDHERYADATPDIDAQSTLTLLAHGAGTVDGTDPEDVAERWESARASGLRTHAHVGRSPGRRGEISGLDRRGLLDDTATLVHGSHLDASDLDLIASAGSLLSLTPASDMASGRGVPPIQGLIDRNIDTGLGVDDEAVAPGDIFAQMRAANSLQHATMFDLKLAGKAGLPKLLNTRQVIKFATSGGARVAGLGKVTGSIEPGKQADIIVLRTDRPNIHPINDPIGAVVWGMDTSNVDLVLVAGKVVVRGGTIQADVEKARNAATDSRRRVAEASGMVTAGLSGDKR
jgi:cytosine/adenosine deaminase-related metal-dependent hydrolase